MPDAIACIIDDREIQRTIRALQHWSDNNRPVMEEIGQSYERRVLENFSRESDPEGNPWPRLSATTLQLGLGKGKRLKKSGALSKKGKAYLQGKRLLVESGGLRRNVHYQANRSGVRIGVGGSLPYSDKVPAVHQFGTDKAGRGKKTKIPARQYLAMNDGDGLRLAERDRQMVLQIMHRRLGDVVEGRR